MAGASAERQETAFVDAVKDAVRENQNNPVTLVAGNVTIVGVKDAKKFTGRQASGSEPYTDIQLITVSETFNLSLKGESAPSLAGGGMKGLELAVPGIAKKFMVAAYNHLTKTLKLNIGDKVPDVYGKLNSQDKITIVVGNAAMGGPIDYMYIGPMNLSATYTKNTNKLTLNGKLEPADKYAREHNLFFRLRARREDQRFDPNAKDGSGTPKIYGKSPSKGDSAGRIVVTDSVPSRSIIVNF